VRAVKRGDRNYLPASLTLTPIVVARAPQNPLVVNHLPVVTGAPVRLQIHGGSGTGRVTIAVVDGTATQCRVTLATVTSTSAGTCDVTVVKQGDRDFLAVRTQVTVVFEQLPQSALSIVAPAGIVGTAVQLNVSGGSGTGVLHFTLAALDATRCELRGATLNASSPGACQVTVEKAADARYGAATATMVINFTAKKAHAPVTVTVTPATGLRAGQVILVTGRGFTPGSTIVIAQCARGASTLASCDVAHDVTLSAPASGAFASQALVALRGPVGPTTCATTPATARNCEVLVLGRGPTETRSIDLTFVTGPLKRVLTVTPQTALKNGDIITLSGSGFTPHDRVYYAECLVGPIRESQCDLATYSSVIITSTGVFPTTTVKVATGSIGPATCGTSKSDASACEISVANSSLADSAVATLTFVVP